MEPPSVYCSTDARVVRRRPSSFPGPAISSDRQIHLTLVLPDGTTQPIALPAEAEAGRAAAKIAQTLSFDDGSGTQGWTLVRDTSGHQLAAGAMFSELGLIPDERLRLVSQPSAAASVPPSASAPAPQPVTAPMPQATAPTAAWAAASAPPAWGAPPAPRSGGSSPAARYALIGGFGVLIAVIAVLGTLLATGGSDTVGVSAAPEPELATPQDDASIAPPSDDTGADADSVVDDSAGSEGASAGGSGSLGQTPLGRSGGVTSLTVDLPTSWSAAKLDVPQETGSSTITRTRTEMRARSGGASIVIDALTGFDTSARDNRATLDASYAASQPQYRRNAFLSVPVGTTTGYEWRYELFDDDRGRMARRANVMFDLDGMSFAVLASGTTTTPYAELSTLARRVARSIQS